MHGKHHRHSHGLLRSTGIAVAFAAAFGAMSGVAAAQPGGEDARALFDAGVSALEKGDFATGCPKLVKSLKLVERAGTLLNVAQCDEHDEHLLRARDEWRRGIDLLPANDERLAISKDRLAKLEQRLPKLVVDLAPDARSDPHLSIDGVAVDGARLSAPIPLDPGHHELVLTIGGHSDRHTDVTLAEGDTKKLSLSAGLPSAGAGSSPPASTPATPIEPPPDAASKGAARSTRRTVGFVVFGVGIAGAIAAGVTSGMLVSRNGRIKDECPDPSRCSAAGIDLINGGKPLFVVNAIAWGVGIAGLAAGTFLLVTNPSTPAAPIAFAPTALPGGAGLAAGRF